MWLSPGPDVAPPDAWPRPFDGIPWSTRLGTIAACVPEGLRVADVAADHGALAYALLATGHATTVLATDLRAAPLQAAAERHDRWRAAAAAAGSRWSAPGVPMRVGPGLAPLAGAAMDVAVIAGVGGSVIVAMLQPEALRAAGLTRLVLQPQSGVEVLRRHLHALRWRWTREVLVRSRDRLYPIMVVEPDKALTEAQASRPLDPLDELSALVGPLLLGSADPLLRDWVGALEAKTAARIRHLRAALGSTADAHALGDELDRARQRQTQLDALLR